MKVYGAGSTVSSARDMCRRVETLMSPNSSFESRDADLVTGLKLSQSPIVEISPGHGVAYSWFYYNSAFNETNDKEMTLYQHSGATPGFVSYAVFQPESQIRSIA